MDGTTRPLLALLLVSLSTSACSFTKSPDSKSVELPVQPVSHTKPVAQDENLDVQFALARTFEKERDLERAAGLYRSILMKDRRHVGAIHRLAIICDQQGRQQESRRLFGQALALRPTSADLYCDLGYSYYCRQQWLHAERNFRLALEVESRHERAHRHLGLTLAAQGKDEVALKELARGGCSKAEARANLAAMQTFSGRLDEAATNCELARKADPDNRQIVAQVGQIETALAKASAKAQAEQEILLARKQAQQSSSVQAVGYESMSNAQPTPASGITPMVREQRIRTAQTVVEPQPEEPAESTTGPLQRLLKWRRVEKSDAK